MPRAASRDLIYYRRRYAPEVIELCVRWYLTYRLSYRDLCAMMAERHVPVTHTTIMRWVHRFLPEFERRWARFAKPVGSSWRMDETVVSVRGRWHYLYGAVDRNGKSVHPLLCADKTIDSAQAFFRQAVAGSGWPRKINLEGNAATHRAPRLLGQEDARWRSVEVRSRRYLNNVVEQDHRAIKRRSASMLGMKSFRTAAVTLSGIGFHHRIRKRQFALCFEQKGRTRSLKELWEQATSIAENSDNTDPPLTHQISTRITPARFNGWRARSAVVRYARKIAFGHCLYLLVMPNGSHHWRYRYRFHGREKMMSFGPYPEVPAETAWARHRAARELLDSGIDPVSRKSMLRRISAPLGWQMDCRSGNELGPPASPRVRLGIALDHQAPGIAHPIITLMVKSRRYRETSTSWRCTTRR